MATPVRLRQRTIGDYEVVAARQGNEYIGHVRGPKGAGPTLRRATLEHLWNELLEEVGRSGPDYLGFEGGINRFLHFFRSGFSSPAYNKPDGEAGYKREARKKLLESLPLERAVNSNGSGQAVLNVYRATNLVDPKWEQPKVEKLLQSGDGDAFIRSVARFAQTPGKATLQAVEAVLRPHDAAKWTIVTYLPFLWEPAGHMFLKPVVMKDYANRVGHRFAFEYNSVLDFGVYESLLDLAAVTEREIVNLGPRDRIDIQSFIWVVGSYEKGREQPQD
jgi:hypothetical protein